MTIDTRKAPRRALNLGTLDELKTDVAAIDRGHAAGTLVATGNWSPGQVFEHLAIFWRCSLDGFPPQVPPWWMRALGRLLRPIALRMPARPGLKLPAAASFLVPDESISYEQGLSSLRSCIARVEAGERMSVPSPVLGRLTHEQWLRLHLNHASLHLGFLWADGVK